MNSRTLSRLAVAATFKKTNMIQSENPHPHPDAANSWLNQADAFARREPAKAVASAFGVGFLINLLPIAAIVGALAAIAFTLVRPALLVFGLLKVWELCPAKNNQTSNP